MRLFQTFAALLFAALVCLAAQPARPARAQSQTPPPAQTDEVVRVETELAQTDVMVFDRDGRFVEGLRPEQFELKVDGKLTPVSFAERVTAGSAAEFMQRERASSRVPSQPASAAAHAWTRGRLIIFFVDDMHLSADGASRTRKALQHFIEEEMGDEDLVAVASASGRVGFLQQFTGHKGVLRAAAARLLPRPSEARGFVGRTPMTEHMALTIERKRDEGVFTFYVSECMKEQVIGQDRRLGAGIRRGCEAQVTNVARHILLQSASVTAQMFDSLENLLRASAQLPGRKLVFFVSDGFLLDAGPRSASLDVKFQRAVDAARRAGAVVYTTDAKGLASGALDATNNIPVDPNGRIESALLREIAASQDALHALAEETGGRALRNSNSVARWVTNTLQETSNYYLLAWRPEAPEQKGGRFKRVEVNVVGHPEYTVRLARGYLDAGTRAARPDETGGRTDARGETKQAADIRKANGSSSEADLRAALSSFAPRAGLPTQLSVGYLDTPANGTVLSAATQVPSDALSYGADARRPAEVDLAGVILNAEGKTVGDFRKRLRVSPPAHEGGGSGVVYTHRAPLAPGLYQVRVAARDVGSGRVGSAAEWVEVPDLKSEKLTLSSLLVGLLDGRDEGQVRFSVDRRFERSARLSFLVFAYNAARGAGGRPDLDAQAQIIRDGRGLASSPPLSADASDPARVAFSGSFPLRELPAGRYVLRVSVTDKASGATATERVRFLIE